MFYRLLLLTALLVSLISCGQSNYRSNLATVTIVDRNGLKETISGEERLVAYDRVNFQGNHPYSEVVRVYKRDPTGNIHSISNTYYDNGQPHQYLEVTNGRACGKYQQWHENGHMALSGTVLEGSAELTEMAVQSWQFDGLCYSWNNQGTLVAEINYSKGLLHGKSSYFHDCESLWKEVNYCEGLPEGTAITYYKSGSTLQTCSYKNGLRSGALNRYWCDGSISCEEEYCEGKLQSAQFYHADGRKACSVVSGFGWKAVCAKDFIVELWQVQNGQLEGEVKVLNPSGELLQTYHVKEGQKHGEDTEYYTNEPGLKPKIQTLWVEGVLQGTVTTWYPSGVPESKKEIHNNKKQGMLTAWYLDGSLMLIEEYDTDNLVRGEYYKRGETHPTSRVSEGEGKATLFDESGNFSGRVQYKNGIPVL